MRTIEQLLRKMGACNRAIRKYSGERRDFKNAFVTASPEYAQFIIYKLFCDVFGPDDWAPQNRPVSAKDYPGLPTYQSKLPSYQNRINIVSLSLNCRNKIYRIKYWPDIKRRLIELGVKL